MLRNLSEAKWRALEGRHLMWRRGLSEASKYVCIECLSLIMEGVRGLGVVNQDVMSILNEDLKTLDWLGIGVGPSDYESRKHELYT